MFWITHNFCRSQWPRDLRRGSTAARLLRSWVPISPGVWMSVCCDCCVLSGRVLCDGLITRQEESYRLWCVVVCDLETSWMRRPWPALGCSATGKKHIIIINKLKGKFCLRSMSNKFQRNVYESYVYWTVHHYDSWRIKDQFDVTCFFTPYVLNMFRALIYPS